MPGHDALDEGALFFGVVEGVLGGRKVVGGDLGVGRDTGQGDVDLLVVLDVEGSRRQAAARIGAALHEFRVPKDIVVTTPDAFQRRRHVPGTLERSAALEGEVLRASR